jgi:hypothetical protein
MIGVLRLDYRRELGIFLFTTASRTAVEPTEPPIQWVLGALSLEVKRPGRKADHSLVPRSKNEWSYTSTPQYVFIAWCLVKHMDNITFNFIGGCIQKFPDWPPGARTANGTILYH